MPAKPLPKILAFDTASDRASLALLEGPEVVAELRLQAHQRHSELLLSSVDFLLDRMGWQIGELGLVAVGIGPGSFTGIRIGIATALGIAQSLSIPLAGISGLDAIAYQIAAYTDRLAVILDAQREQVFYAEYQAINGRIRPIGKPRLLSRLDLEPLLAQGRLCIAGDVTPYATKVSHTEQRDRPRLLAVDLFLAPAIGRLAWSSKRTWRSGKYLKCEPLYIRPPDAFKNKTRKR